ncbi:MAG: hypothetical protein ACXAEU_21100 [Candidatus Hodarchaeales archaeon]
MYVSVPDEKKNEIVKLIETPKKISEIASVINLSRKKTGAYLRILTNKGEIRKIPDFNDLRSFYYVTNNN